MNKITLLLFLFLIAFNSFAQKSCSNSEEIIEDLNTISKCSIKTSQKEIKGSGGARQISVRISAPKRRFLKRTKKEVKKVAKMAKKAKTALALNSSNVSLSVGANINEKVDIKANKSGSSNIAEALSKLELRKAISFRKVDELPLFEKCKAVKKSEKTNCFNSEMVNHIQKYFNYPEEAVENKIEGDVWVRFIIDESGNVRNIKTLGPENGELLNKEAKRVVSKLPKFVPGIKDGKKVLVKYGFPINFSLN